MKVKGIKFELALCSRLIGAIETDGDKFYSSNRLPFIECRFRSANFSILKTNPINKALGQLFLWRI